MGLSYHFYIQLRVGEEWVVPANHTNRSQDAENLGYFTRFLHRNMTFGLFGGKHPLFPMRDDYPPNIEKNFLFQRISSAFGDWFHGWLPFEDLMLDCWDETHLLVSKPVPASYALLFGDGQQPFPFKELLWAGLEPKDVEELEETAYCTKGKVADQPIDYRHGGTRFQLESVPHPERLVEVTWKLTVSHFLGPWRTEDFRNTRQYGSEERLRIICLLI